VAGFAVSAMLLAAAGCGSDDDAGDAGSTPPAPTATTPTQEPVEPNHEIAPPAEPEPEEEPETVPPAGEATPPRNRPPDGGSEPVRAEALLTGRGGRITPRLVRVPAYVAVRLVLRAADGRAYELVVEGRRLRVSGRGNPRGLDLAGLQPGDRYTASAASGGSVVIEASAEPGP